MTATIVGAILAGGQSLRMGGGHKFLHELNGSSLLEWVARRLRPQVDLLIVSAAAGPPAFEVGLTIVPDEVEGAGPLGGIHAAARWAKRTVGSSARIVTVPADTPFLPLDLVARLTAEPLCDPPMIAVAASRSQTHHAIAVWPTDVGDELETWLAADNRRSVRNFMVDRPVRIVAFDGAIDPFFNVNTPQDLREAQLMAASFATGDE